MKKVLCVTIVLFIFGQNTILQANQETIKDANNPNEVLRVTCDKVINVLKNESLDHDSKKQLLDEIVSPFFDFELMSKLSLGKTNWMKLTDSEQKRFTILFTKLLKNTYLDLITRYKDEKLVLGPAQSQKNGVSILMEVLSGEKKIGILYKLRRLENRWLAYDVEIEGVSILMTYKAQFDDILKNGRVGDLFANLEKKST